MQDDTLLSYFLSFCFYSLLSRKNLTLHDIFATGLEAKIRLDSFIVFINFVGGVITRARDLPT